MCPTYKQTFRKKFTHLKEINFNEPKKAEGKIMREKQKSN
jgi:hypothetical protein